MISSGDSFELKISDTALRVRRVWGSGVKTCGAYWIGLEKVAYFVMPGFSLNDGVGGHVVVLVGGIETELMRLIELHAYGKASLKKFQSSPYFNRGEMPVEFEMEK